jgi:hypothetical protein
VVDIVGIDRTLIRATRARLHHDGFSDGGRGVESAMVAVGADIPRRSTRGLPGPVLLEIVLLRLPATSRENNAKADKSVEGCVDKNTPRE